MLAERQWPAAHFYVMASAGDGLSGFDETRAQRVARYWKTAAGYYDQAWDCDTEEITDLYIQVAMCWAALATELERAPIAPVSDVHADHPAPHR